MKIKHRLWVSFCIIIILPILMAYIALSALSGMQSNSGYWSEGLQFSNSLRVIYENTQSDYKKIIKWKNESPDIFLDREKMTEFCETLAPKSSCIIVRVGTEIFFDGRGEAYKAASFDLPSGIQRMSGSGARLILEGELPFIMQQTDVVFSNQKRGNVYLITQANALLPLGKQMLIDVLLSVILILAFTAVILIFWIYRGVFSQVNKLAKAAENIKEGNLDFSIKADGDDEMSMLVNTFESMRRQLQQDTKDKIAAENEQRQLISNIAHDLKTPLTSIRGYTEGILDGVADTPEKREAYLKTIDKKAKEMNTLLNELTLYSKLDTNRIPYNFKHQNVIEYFNDCIEELKIDLDNQGIDTSYSNLVDNSVEMIADPEQLMRVILNIVGNSVKYKSEDRSFINFKISDVGDFIQVEIADNGKGIDAKDLPHIFDRMYRGDASRNSSIQGSGIGLSVAKKIIEDHGGQIWATSKVGKGTVVYFVLRKYEEVEYGQNTDS